MGFSCICHAIILPKPLERMVQIICHLRFIIAVILSYYGLLSPPEIPLDPYSEHDNHLASTDAQSHPSTAIKSELPVVELASIIREPTCVTCLVCLGWLEAKDEVRELGNCRHAFHKECIDRWIDIGHFTCPLCRSPLLPLRRVENIDWLRWARIWVRL